MAKEGKLAAASFSPTTTQAAYGHQTRKAAPRWTFWLNLGVIYMLPEERHGHFLRLVATKQHRLTGQAYGFLLVRNSASIPARMRACSLDPVVQFVAAAAQRRLGPVHVFLFGSRARGTARRTSDYDFAIDVDSVSVSERDWLAFLAYLDDAAPTLNRLDIINLSAALDTTLRDEITRTAVRVDDAA